MIRDELSGWLGSFDQYSKRKGADAAKWLEVFGGRPIVVDREGGNPKTIYVPRAAVSIAGGIQPETLRRALGAEHRENGLAARLLLTCPPRRPKKWTEADISIEADKQIEWVFDRLYTLTGTPDKDSEPQPVLVPLTQAGKADWVQFFNEHAQEHAELTGDVAAAWSKLEAYAARFALLAHFVRWAAGDPGSEDPNAIDAESITCGVGLSRWFGHEAKRAYAILGETPDQRAQRRLVELIRRRGGFVSVRDLQRIRSYPKAEQAEGELNGLAEVGLGRWEDTCPGSQGGRPTRVLSLHDTTDTDETDDSATKMDVVSVSVSSDECS